MSTSSNFWMGTPAKTEQLPTMSPQQQQMFEGLLSMVQGQQGNVSKYMNDLFSDDPQALQRMFAPAQREFQEQTIPGIAEQFSGMGSGAQSSSAFGQTLGAAGASLSEKLASMREGLRSQGMSSFQNMMQQGLSKEPFAYQQTPRQPGFLESVIGPALGATGSAAGSYFGGPAFAATQAARRNAPESGTGSLDTKN